MPDQRFQPLSSLEQTDLQTPRLGAASGREEGRRGRRSPKGRARDTRGAGCGSRGGPRARTLKSRSAGTPGPCWACLTGWCRGEGLKEAEPAARQATGLTLPPKPSSSGSGPPFRYARLSRLVEFNWPVGSIDPYFVTPAESQVHLSVDHCVPFLREDGILLLAASKNNGSGGAPPGPRSDGNVGR